MLDQLVESKSNTAENTRRSGFLLTTFVIMVSILIAAWLVSLYGKDFVMSGDLELSTLVAPVLPPEEAPPPPPEQKPEQQKALPDADVRKEIIQNIMETPKEVTKIEVTKQAIPPRRLDVKTIVGDRDADAKVALSSDYKGPVSGVDNKGIASSGGTGTVPDDDPPPVIKATPTPKPVPKTISKGVINGSAISLPKPPYPAAARAVRASGAVNVQVTIDEDGRVISANAVSGHPLLRSVAEQAARGARFSPTQLSGVPVKVTGVIVYNFVP